jgi:hypothetical protein
MKLQTNSQKVHLPEIFPGADSANLPKKNLNSRNNIKLPETWINYLFKNLGPEVFYIDPGCFI